MIKVYPVVLTKLEDGFMAYIPDFESNTQGKDLAEVIAMARDAIGLLGIDMEDDGKQLPEPSDITEVEYQPGEILSVADIDFVAYRRAHERRRVRMNVSLPAWLKVKAEEAGLNVSAVLQNALKEELNIK